MTKHRPPPPPPYSNRRAHPRFELIAQVELHRDGEVWLLGARDISAGGMFIDLQGDEHAVLETGDSLHVVLDLGQSESEDGLRLDTDAEVVRIETNDAENVVGLGVRWTISDPDQVVTLARILERAQTAKER